MNTPNPLIPQGSLQQQSKGKSNLRIAVFTIVAIHVVVLGGLLMQGCGEKTAKNGGVPSATNTDTFPQMTTDIPIAANTNLVPAMPSTNVAITPPTNPVVNLEPVTPTPGVEGRTYVVSKGDFLASIAKKNGVSLKALEAANPGVVPTKLKIGQKLQIPGGGTAAAMPESTAFGSASSGDTKTYTVKPGDTLTKIAKVSGAKLTEIKKLNDLKTDQIKVGQKLKLPQRASAEAAPAPSAPAPSGGGVVASTNATR